MVNYFIFPLGNTKINLGIPKDNTEKIVPINRDQNILLAEDQGQNYISIPILFKLNGSISPHAVVLKNCNTMLLCPKIDSEITVSSDEIYEMPKALQHFFVYVNGIFFRDNDLILIMDTDLLLEKLL